MQIKLVIPDELKLVLVEDWDNVSRQSKVSRTLVIHTTPHNTTRHNTLHSTTLHQTTLTPCVNYNARCGSRVLLCVRTVRSLRR
jgi:hypothetical protein